VIAAAEAALYAWLEQNAPVLAAAHDSHSLRRHRLALAERRPEIAHDFTVLRRESLALLLDEAGYPRGLAEEALEGKQAGDALSVTVPPELGYGERDEDLTQVVPLEMFEGGDAVEPGMQFHAQAQNGQPIVVTVTNVTGDQVTIDANHPLAGQNLNFDVKVVDVRDASEEEVAHGHVH